MNGLNAVFVACNGVDEEPVAHTAVICKSPLNPQLQSCGPDAVERLVEEEALMPIDYMINEPISADQFIDVLNRSTLGQRRPIDDRECMEAMVKHANLLVTAWDGNTLVGVARSMTDFVYACYLSDLAVDAAYQRRGVGKALTEAVSVEASAKMRKIRPSRPLPPSISTVRSGSRQTRIVGN